MHMKLGYFTPILGAAAVAAAISVAPVASAAPGTQTSTQPQQSCGVIASGTACQSSGNVQINDSPPPVQYYPYGGEASLL